MDGKVLEGIVNQELRDFCGISLTPYVGDETNTKVHLTVLDVGSSDGCSSYDASS